MTLNSDHLYATEIYVTEKREGERESRARDLNERVQGM
jgi:hypothetical protein